MPIEVVVLVLPPVPEEPPVADVVVGEPPLPPWLDVDDVAEVLAAPPAPVVDEVLDGPWALEQAARARAAERSAGRFTRPW